MRVSVISARQTSPSMTPVGVPMIATPSRSAPNENHKSNKNEEQ